jgi:hypothetical protein
MPAKESLTSTSAIGGLLGVAGRTITSMHVFKHGSAEVVDILCGDGLHYYVKFSQGRVDVGGTTDFGTGTLIGGR